MAKLDDEAVRWHVSLVYVGEDTPYSALAYML